MIEERYPQLRKMYLTVRSLDFVGPKKNGRILLKWLKTDRPNIMNVGAEKPELCDSDCGETQVLGVLAARKSGDREIDEESILFCHMRRKKAF